MANNNQDSTNNFDPTDFSEFEKQNSLNSNYVPSEIERKAKLWDAFQADLEEWINSDYSTVEIGTMIIDSYSK